MRWQIAYPTASALPSNPGGAKLNQTASTRMVAIGTSERARFVERGCVDTFCIAFIIWVYTTECKKDDENKVSLIL